MYFGARWFARFSNRRLILIALLGFMGVYSLVGLSSIPLQVTLAVLGTGLCFGVFWVAIVGYASDAAPPGLSATAQALMSAGIVGLGWSMGSIVNGYLWDNVGSRAVFFFAAFSAILSLLIFLMGSREDSVTDSRQSTPLFPSDGPA
jgi:MFS family permease